MLHELLNSDVDVLAENKDGGRCLHGSTVEAVGNPQYAHVLETYERLVESTIDSEDSEEFRRLLEEFQKGYGRFLCDDEFGKYIFALSVEGFHHPEIQSDHMLTKNLELALDIRYRHIPQWEQWQRDASPAGASPDPEHRTRTTKWLKYHRDIQTKRGIINCLARETMPYCNCMKDWKKEAKSMDKIAVCNGCRETFPKPTMLACSKCMSARYCSTECQLKDWSKHKERCKKIRAMTARKDETKNSDAKSTAEEGTALCTGAGHYLFGADLTSCIRDS